MYKKYANKPQKYEKCATKLKILPKTVLPQVYLSCVDSLMR